MAASEGVSGGAGVRASVKDGLTLFNKKLAPEVGT